MPLLFFLCVLLVTSCGINSNVGKTDIRLPGKDVITGVKVGLSMTEEDANRFCLQPAFAAGKTFKTKDEIFEMTCTKMGPETYRAETIFDLKAKPSKGNQLKVLIHNRIAVQLENPDDAKALTEMISLTDEKGIPHFETKQQTELNSKNGEKTLAKTFSLSCASTAAESKEKPACLINTFFPVGLQ